MLIDIDGKIKIDTDLDLNSVERHILQKLFGWKTMVDSIAQFREKKKSALLMGWNGSGPIQESRALALVIQKLEKELELRLKKGDESIGSLKTNGIADEDKGYKSKKNLCSQKGCR